MTEDRLNDELHPHIARLLKQYRSDLAEIAPSSDLDARIDHLVAAHRPISAVTPQRRPRMPYLAAAAGVGALAIGVGIFIGMRLERGRELAATDQTAVRDTVWPPADLAMWPTDSVSFKVPAEYSAQGNLVAVDPNSKNTSTRYWIDVVVSNDGTFRIERIVPAETANSKGGHDGAKPQVQ
jgi:hypothetical protein